MDETVRLPFEIVKKVLLEQLAELSLDDKMTLLDLVGNEVEILEKELPDE